MAPDKRADWPFEAEHSPERKTFQRGLFAKHQLVEHLGFQIQDSSAGYFRIDIPWQEHLSNYGQEMHGGIHATLVDSVTGQAIFTLLKPGYGLSTVHLSTEYHKPFRTGTLKAEGHVTKWGRTLCYARATLSANDQIIAEGKAIYAIFKSRS